MLCLLKGCGKCRGDLMQDGDEWRCIQCGYVYYPAHSSMGLQMSAEDFKPLETAGRLAT